MHRRLGGAAELALGKTIDRALARGEVHSYRIAAHADELIQIALDELGVNLEAALFDPLGQRLLETSAAGSAQERVSVSHIAASAGAYRIEVRLAGRGAAAGRYQITLQQLRRAMPQDDKRIAAQAAFIDGTQLFEKVTEQSYRWAVFRFAAARSIYQEIGMRTEEAVTLNAMGRFCVVFAPGEAREYYKRALEIYREERNREGEGITLRNLGFVYHVLREHRQAIEYYQQALAILREVKDREGQGSPLDSLGNEHYALGQFEQAISYYEQAVAAYREAQDRAEEGHTLNNMGTAYHRLGQFAKAIACYQQALAVAGELKDGGGKGRALYNLLIVYYRLGDYEKSFASYLALTQREAEPPAGERPARAGASSFDTSPHQYEKALQYHEHALAVFQDLQDRTGEAAALRNLGIAYCRLGQGGQAIYYLEQALAMGRELADRAAQAAALIGLGNTYDSLGQDAKAIALLEQALAISREIKDRAIEGAALNGLGAAHSSLDQYDKAICHFQEALELLRALRERAGQAYALDNLGNVHARLGDAEAALGYYEQALAIYREAQDRVGQGQALRNLGDAYSSLRQYEKAADCYQQALAVRRDIHPGGPGSAEGPNPYADSPALPFRRPPQDPRSRDDHEIEYLEQALTTSRQAMAAAAVAAGGQPRLMVQLGHSRPVTSVAFSPDGRYVLTGSWDGTARLWEAATGTELRRFEGHAGSIYAVAFSPDGNYVLTGSRDHTARLWAATTGEEVRRFNGHADPVNAVAFSPDGRYVLTGSGDGLYPLTSRDNSTRLWDAATGREVRRFDGQTGVVLCVAFSPDGRYALAGGTDGTARLLRLETGEEVRRFHGHSNSVRSAAFSPDGRYVLTGSADKTARLWQTDGGAEVRRFEGHSDEVSSVAFSPDGKTVATASWDHTARLWAAASGAELRRFAADSVAYYAVAFSPDGRYVLTGLWEMMARLWDAATAREVQRFAGNAAPVTAVAFSPDGRYVLTAGGPETGLSEGKDNTACLWELETGREVRRFAGHSEQVHAVAFSPDGRYVLTGSGFYSDYTARLWEAATGKEVRRFEGEHQLGVASVAFSPDSRYVLTGTFEAAILWEAATGRQVRKFSRNLYNFNSVAFSPDGRYVLGGLSDYTAVLWEVETGSEVRVFQGHSSEVNAVAFSPDGRYVLTGSWDDTARLWEAATGKEVRRLEGHAAGVTAVAWSPDGKFLLTAGSDMTARLWAAATGEQLRTFSGHSGQLAAVAFSPDGRQALTGGADATTRLWDVATSQQLNSLISFSNGSWAVVDANGHFDASNLEETTGLRWVMVDEPMKTYALGIFMRDYYEPRLLPRLRNGERFHARSISELNRAQPEVTVTALAPDPEHPGLVTVTVKVKRAISDHQRDAQGGPRKTEVYDVRLFRDGQIVAQEPEYRLPGEAVPPAASDSEREQIRQRQLQSWRDHALIRPSQRVELEPDGSMTITFSKIRLPRRDAAGTMEFSAYAFNEDRVKSNTDRAYAVSQDAAGSTVGGKTFLMPSGLPVRQGRAYVIAVGVNRYQNAAWNLQFAANDARSAHRDLAQSLKNAGEFASVIEETLISDDLVEADEQRATKENFRSAIAAIAHLASPEDLVLIYYAGHGYAGSNGQYYFFTEQTGAGSQQEITPELLADSISSDEMSDWLRAVDAGDMVLIVDACQSAGTVSGEEGEAFKPGPMGNRGLGQLAYDKGMRILAASQIDDVALEVGRLQHGFLTYALLKDGLEDQKARPAGGAADELTMKQWLEYGEKRVPVLQEALVNGKLQELLDREGTERSVQLLGAPGGRRFQKPLLFDFARSKREVLLARPAAK